MYPKSSFPLVTIAIPCYNEGNFIKRAFLSALNQTYPNIEVVISDAGSNDHTTLKFLSEAVWKQNVEVLYHTNGTSKYDNWTAMIEASRGEYIIILPAKHFLYPEGINKLIKPFINNHHRNLAYVRGCMVYELPDGTKTKYVPSEMSSLIEGKEELQRLWEGNTCEVVITLYHLDRLKKSLPFNTYFERTFVWLQNAKLASKWPVYFINADIGEWTNSETPEQSALKHSLATAEIPALYEAFAILNSSVGLKSDIESYRNKWSLRTKKKPKASIRSILQMELKNYLPRPILSFARYSVFNTKELIFRTFPTIFGR